MVSGGIGITILIVPLVLGLALGSYFNSWIWRKAAGRRKPGRSVCVGCRRQLAWYENIPLLSFLALRGRCRTCRARIPASYFWVELATALLFVAVTAYHLSFPTFNAWRLGRDLFFAGLLMVVFVYDLKYQFILTGLVWAGAVIGFLVNTLALSISPVGLLIGFLVGGGFFLAQYLVSQGRWVGGGDVRLGAMLGVWLGFPQILVALFISYILGALMAIPLLLSGKKSWGSAIPFGTFLAVGAFVSLLWGGQIIGWYWGVIGG